MKSSIDWKKLRNRLKAIELVTQNGEAPGPEEARKILRERARLLAREPLAAAPADERQVVEFLLAGERYAVEAALVREVHALGDLTPVPSTPPFIAGVFNLRGRIISVIDLKRLFDLPERGFGDLNKVIIVQSESMEFGLLADAILGVRNMSMDQLQPPLPTLTGIRQEYLKGIAADGEIVLDGEKLLSDRRLVISEETK